MNADARRAQAGRTICIRHGWHACGAGGYTLIEMLVVLGIILGMMSLIMTSVSSMLHSSRMSRTLSLLIGAVDEARTNAISYRRATKLDLTRIDVDANGQGPGKLNRLTTTEPSFIDNFDSYPDASGDPSPSSNGWQGTFSPNSDVKPSIYYDGTRCLRMFSGSTYWNVCAHMDVVQQSNFEQIVMARVKFLPQTARSGRQINVYAAMQNGSGGYCMSLIYNPPDNTKTPPQYGNNQVTLGGGSLAPIGNATINLQVDGGSTASSACLVENVWYRVLLSVKRSTVPGGNASAIVAGKVWADGQLEPLKWTVGPAQDNSPLWNGPGGFESTGGDALLDDVLIDGRPIRVLPEGLRVDTIDLSLVNDSSDPNTVPPAAGDSPYAFPIQFRPDGTTGQKYVIRLTDLSTGDRSYMTIEQNTGRAHTAQSLKDALQQ